LRSFSIGVADDANESPQKPLEDEDDDEYENDFWPLPPKPRQKVRTDR